LYGETDPKEDVELDETFENLMGRVHFLDAAVSTEKLVHLPAEFVINFPAKTNVCYFRSGYDGRDDIGENVHRYMEDAGGSGRGALNFTDFNDGVQEEKKVEYAKNQAQVNGVLQISYELT